MSNWIFFYNKCHVCRNQSLVGRKIRWKEGWDGRGIALCGTGVKHNTWLSFKRDAMILAGYHLIGCDNKALWEFRGEQEFRLSEKGRKLGGGLVKG